MKINEYKLATIYTSLALAAKAAYSIYESNLDVPEESVDRDMILGLIYASSITLSVSFYKTLKNKSIISLVCTGLWLGRVLMGVILSGISDVYAGEDNTFVFWSVSIVGLITSSVSTALQIIRKRREDREKNEEISPVKLRFMEA